MKVIPVILCGGAGTRLWPLSRELYPKQLLSLIGDRSLLQNTITRCSSHPDVAEPVLVCNEAHRFLVAEQLREIGLSNATILLEPEGRNTAPAVAIAAHEVLKDNQYFSLQALRNELEKGVDPALVAQHFATIEPFIEVPPVEPPQGIQKIDRESVVELREVASILTRIQTEADKADLGLNPWALPA